MVRTRGADRFSTELTAQMGPTALTATVLSTAGSPPSPCRLVVDHDDPAKAEIILFDGSFSGTSFITTSLANRYQQGSAAGSGITHDVGATVIFAALGSHHEEIHDALETHDADAAGHGATSLPTANTIVRRDASARFRSGTPNNDADVATKAYVDSAFPIGGIIMWSGSVGSIPAGWHLCDGTAGTVDLRNRFVVGAGSTYGVGNTGGATSHTHSGPSHSHSGAGHDHSISSSGSHDHGGVTGQATAQPNQRAVGQESVNYAIHQHPLSSDGSHSHGGSTGFTTPGSTGSGGTGNTSSNDSRPPYYAIAFIQRVS